MKISFYTTCMARLKHVRHTLPKNLIENEDYNDCEFVLLDYNSNDGLEDWVKANLMRYIESGKLIYAKTTEPDYFFHNHAKNMAARLCTGDVVCGIDADNYTATDDSNGEGLAKYLNRIFTKPREGNIFVRALGWEHREKEWHSIMTYRYYSCSGKIACLRKHFMEFRGYDEHLQGHYFDEEEFWKRLEHVCGFKHIRLPVGFSKAISHTNYERLKNINPELINKSELNRKRKENSDGINQETMNATWVKHNYPNGARNQEICQANIANKISKPNKYGQWGRGTVTINFDEVRSI